LYQTTIFWPVAALMGWTLLVLLLIPWRRLRAAFAGQLTAEDFRCGESERVPAQVRLPNRVFMNLLEVPLLFYVLALMLFVTHAVDGLFLGLAWAYVALRVLHSLIYLTYNHVMHRLLAFAASNLLVAGIWLRFVVVVLGGH
jgi:hypothetical protein